MASIPSKTRFVLSKRLPALGRRIAILGGLDLDFVCRKTPAEIRARAQAMLDRSPVRAATHWAPAIAWPDYVPDENYFAMVEPAVGRLAI